MHQIYKNVFFTKGYNRTLIFDSLKSKIHFLPNEMYDSLVANKFLLKNTDDLLFHFLNKKGIIHKTETNLLDCFINLDNTVEVPYNIATLVIELSDVTSKNLYKLREENILQYNFIFSNDTTLPSIEAFIDFINESEADTIELTFCEGFIYANQLFDLIKPIKKIIILNNFAKLKLNDTSTNKNRFVNDLTNINAKLSINLITYFQSLKFHTYFYKKMFIEKDGTIKNSKEIKDVFGNLNDNSYSKTNQIINQNSFKQFWEIKKEETLVCRDCEFKNLCVDNRLPYKGSDNKWIHNEECDYNPYISKWSHEEGYLPLNASGISLENGKQTYNKELLEHLNESLWE